MTRTHASTLLADALSLARRTDTVQTNGTCAACGRPAAQAVPFVQPKSFNDRFLFADRLGSYLCVDCDAVMTDAGASTTVEGCASAAGFTAAKSNADRLRLLMDPPEPPFAVAIITAKRQHVWWMAPVTYDRDLIQVQFGHRRLTVDRPRAIAAAREILDYERRTTERDRKTTYVFTPLSRELKAPTDGQHTAAFLRDGSEEARRVRRVAADLTLGDLWATMQIRAAVRAVGASTPEEALAACREEA